MDDNINNIGNAEFRGRFPDEPIQKEITQDEKIQKAASENLKEVESEKDSVQMAKRNVTDRKGSDAGSDDKTTSAIDDNFKNWIQGTDAPIGDKLAKIVAAAAKHASPSNTLTSKNLALFNNESPPEDSPFQKIMDSVAEIFKENKTQLAVSPEQTIDEAKKILDGLQDDDSDLLAIPTPERIAANVFNMNIPKSPREDAWALGLILYEMAKGSPPAFADKLQLEKMQAAIEKRDEYLEEIKKLPSENKSLILNWHEKSDTHFPDTKLESLAKNYYKAKCECRNEYAEYIDSSHNFLDKFNPTSNLEKVIKELLTVDPEKVMTLDDILDKLIVNSPEEYDKSGGFESGDTQSNSSYDSDIPFLGTGGNDSWEAESIGAESAEYNEFPVMEPFDSDEKNMNTSIGLQDSSLEELKKMQAEGCDVAGWRGVDGRTLLHMTAEMDGKSDVIRFLCSIGADVDARDDEQKTPLHVAAENEGLSAAQILLKNGANYEVIDKDGKTPLDYAEDSDSGIRYLDENKFLIGFSDEGTSENHLNWYLNQAHLNNKALVADNISEGARQMLRTLTLQAFSKAADISERDSKGLHLTTSPVISDDVQYHRSVENHLQKSLHEVVASQLKIPEENIFVVDTPLVKHALSRQYPIYTLKDVNENVEKVIDSLSKDNEMLLIDASEFGYDKLEENLNSVLEILEKHKEWNNSYHQKITAFATFKHQNADILSFEQPFLTESNRSLIDNVIRHGGFVPSPDKLRETWLGFESLEEIYKELEIPVALSFTQSGDIQAVERSAGIPTVFSDYNKFLEHPAVRNFEKLSELDDAPPYLKVLPKATISLLKGLQERGVDKAFEEENLDDLLQISYFRMINSMGTAIFKKDKQVEFINEFELINQEIQNMLGVVSLSNGYNENDFEKYALEKLTSGDNPIIPQGVGTPQAFIKASAMRCLSSTLSAAEAQKGDNKSLNIAILKDTYYEEVDVLTHGKGSTISLVNGDKSPSESEFITNYKDPIDMFVCEFHHNISLERESYKPEDVLGQLLHMSEQNMLAEKCTVAIDTTVDLERSEEMRELLKNDKIQNLVNEGKLNIVFLRSGQKFDMFGLDNYYGGVATVVNSQDHFREFNDFMKDPEDQLSGISYQGMTHLQAHGKDLADKYRKAIMDNTKKLYDKLPPEILTSDRNKLIAISRIEDKRTVFLDIKAGVESGEASRRLRATIGGKLKQVARSKGTPLTSRSSFGFPYSNITIIEPGKLRFNPGLEGEESIDIFAEFFEKLQQVIEEVENDFPEAGTQEIKIKKMTEAVRNIKLSKSQK